MHSHDPIKARLAKAIQKQLDIAFADHQMDKDSIYSFIGAPPNFKMGHFAFACFPLAKALKMGPPQISNKLAENFPCDELILEVRPAGPYLNFICHTEALAENILGNILSGEFFKREVGNKLGKTMIEYSQPNTHKELHVGHMRNMCLGNSLIRLLKYLNNEVIPVTYPGDSGTHVAKVLWYLKNINENPRPEDKQKLGSWIGCMYSTANNYIASKKDTDEELTIKEGLTEVLGQLEKKSGEYYDLWLETREWSLEQMKKIYRWLDIEFDQWYFESEVDSPSLAYAKQLLEEGHLIEDQGAIGCDLSEEKLGFAMVIKSDGNGLYLTKDLELARQKFQDQKVENNIYVVDNRQARHFKQCFAILKKVGFEHADKCYHLAYEMVELSTGAMSSRTGNYYLVDDLIKNMEDKIKNDFLNKYNEQWTKENIDHTATQIARGAINYGMLSLDPNKKIIFDMDEWSRLDGESGPYLQYSYARILSMVEKLGFNKKYDIKGAIFKEDIEAQILLKLNEFNQTVYQAATNYKPSSLCSYLYELSKLFNKFYAECPVAKAKNEDLKTARLALSYSLALVLEKGLELLGVDCPQRM